MFFERIDVNSEVLISLGYEQCGDNECFADFMVSRGIDGRAAYGAGVVVSSEYQLYMKPIEPMPLVEEPWTDADQEVEPAFAPADDGDKLFVFLSRVEQYGYLLASKMEDSNHPFDPFDLLA